MLMGALQQGQGRRRDALEPTLAHVMGMYDQWHETATQMAAGTGHEGLLQAGSSPDGRMYAQQQQDLFGAVLQHMATPEGADIIDQAAATNQAFIDADKMLSVDRAQECQQLVDYMSSHPGEISPATRNCMCDSPRKPTLTAARSLPTTCT